MSFQRIPHEFGRRGLQSFGVAVFESLYRGILLVDVALLQCGVKRPAVVVGGTRDRPADVERVDSIAGLLAAVVVKMGRPIGRTVFSGECRQRPVGHVAWKSLPERTASTGKIAVSYFACLMLVGEHLQWAVRSIAGKPFGKRAATAPGSVLVS